MSKKYPCPAGREPDCGYPACAHDRQCELSASAGSDTWAVDVKGDTGGWEIGVTRKSFTHGWKSWGWNGDDKEIMFCSTLYCSTPCQPWAFDAMVSIAQKRCDELNQNTND